MGYSWYFYPNGYPADTMKICWRTNALNENYIHSTKYTDDVNISNYPLNLVPFKDIRVRVKYSLLVKQHTLSEETFKFIKAIEDQNSNDETDLYTKQPYQIRGNIHNINDADETILGIFYASSITEKRLFTPPDVNPKHKILYALDYCQGIPSVDYEEGVPENNTQEYLDQSLDRPSRWTIYMGEAYIFEGEVDKNIPENYKTWNVAYSRKCVDCREKGGVMVKPDFWED